MSTEPKFFHQNTFAAAALAAALAVPAAAETGFQTSRMSSPGLATHARDLDDAGRERFPLEGEVVNLRDAGSGVTSSHRATLRLGELEHDAHIQTIDDASRIQRLERRPEFDFRDSYKNNIAAYRLDRMLGLGMIPVTVLREWRGWPAAFTWWVDDVQMDERARRRTGRKSPDIRSWNHQVRAVKLFDQLIHNFDRNQENLLIDDEWRLWMIDHTRSFKVFGKLRDRDLLSPRCSPELLDALRRLDAAELRPLMEGLLTDGQLDGLLERRDRIVKHYEERIAEHGAAAVLEAPAPTTVTVSAR